MRWLSWMSWMPRMRRARMWLRWVRRGLGLGLGWRLLPVLGCLQVVLGEFA